MSQNRPSILYVTSEAQPFAKTGGLADVMYDLPQAMAGLPKVNDSTVIMPLYPKVKAKWGDKLHFEYGFKLDAPYAGVPVRLYCYRLNAVNVFFVDIPGLLDRPNLYGYGDDTYRFAAFSFAVRRFIIDQDHFGHPFDVIHCNDWQTGFVPLLVKQVYWNKPCVLTVHNPAYQGWLNPAQLGSCLGLPESLYASGAIRLGESVDFLKAGVVYADAVNTVSVHHAQELLSDDSAFGGLGWVFKTKGSWFLGITNGLSKAEFDPKTDKSIPVNYDVTDYRKGKAAARAAALAKFSLADDPHTPLFVAISRLTEQKGMDRLWAIGQSMAIAHAKLLILGSGDYDSEGEMYRLQAAFPQNVFFWRGYDNGLAHLLYAGGDFLFMPSRFEPCGLAQLIAMRYGTLPIVSDAGGLSDTVLNSTYPNGTGYVFPNWADRQGLWERTCDALKDYFTPGRMDGLIRNAMAVDSTWAKPAKAYFDLYDRLLRR